MQNLTQLIAFAGDILNRLIPVLIALTLVIFFWGVFKYVRAGKAAGGKDIMIAGLLGLFVMVSVWGIIRIAQNTLLPGGNAGSSEFIRSNIPQVPQR